MNHIAEHIKAVFFDHDDTLVNTIEPIWKLHKHDPRVFEPALSWLKERSIQPEEVLYVGDSLNDAAAALGAGFSFLGVETGLFTAAQFRKLGHRSIPALTNFFD